LRPRLLLGAATAALLAFPRISGQAEDFSTHIPGLVGCTSSDPDGAKFVTCTGYEPTPARRPRAVDRRQAPADNPPYLPGEADRLREAADTVMRAGLTHDPTTLRLGIGQVEQSLTALKSALKQETKR
jgi:hypothetical protein